MQPETTFIYGLIDPRDGFLKYVGKANNVKVRNYRHRCPSDKSKRSSWLISLKRQEVRPESFILEEVPFSEWGAAERFWIDYMRLLGCRLVNATGGGDGVSNVTLETKEKLRLIALARPRPSIGTRLKMSASQFGKKHPNRKKALRPRRKFESYGSEWKRKIASSLKGRKRPDLTLRALGRKLSEETKIKISTKLKNRIFTPEWRLKLSESQKARFQRDKTNSCLTMETVKMN